MRTTAARQPIPPVMTENGAPASPATNPASASPSRGPPMTNIMFTEVMRPRSSSGVDSCMMVCRNTMLIVSKAPVRNSAAKVSQKLDEMPKTTVANA